MRFLNLTRTGLGICLLASASMVASVQAADFCVDTSEGLQSALNEAAANGQDNAIRLVQGRYYGQYLYSSQNDGQLSLTGGWTGSCAERITDPAFTLLDGQGADILLTLSAAPTAASSELQSLTLRDGDLVIQDGGSYAIEELATVEAGLLPIDYFRKVNAYVVATLGRPATKQELSDWGLVLRDNNGSVWRPAQAGLQWHLSNLVGWGSVPPNATRAEEIIQTILNNLFGPLAESLDPQIEAYYISNLLTGTIKERGLVNAVINDLGLLPRVDGQYTRPNGWIVQLPEGLLTQGQFDYYVQDNADWAVTEAP